MDTLKQVFLNNHFHLRNLFSIILIVPVESILVELDYNLWDSGIGFLGWNQVCFLTTLPLDEEEQLSWFVRCSNDLFWFQSTSKSSWSVILLLPSLVVNLGSFWIIFFPSSSGLPFVVTLSCCITLALQVFLKLVNNVLGFFQIVGRFPCVVIRIIIVFPFNQILYLSTLLNTFIENLLYFIFFVTHVQITDNLIQNESLISCRSESSLIC